MTKEFHVSTLSLSNNRAANLIIFLKKDNPACPN